MNEEEIEIKRLKTILIPSARSAIINAKDEESKNHYQKTLNERLERLKNLQNKQIHSLEKNNLQIKKELEKM